MSIVRATEAPIFELPGTRFTALTAPSRGATELSTWILELEPGSGKDGQKHWLDHEEVFIVLNGVLTASVNDEEAEIKPGDALSVPARALMAISNRGEVPVRAVVCIPAGTQATFADGQEIGTPPWAK